MTGKHRPLLILAILAMGAAGRHRVLANREGAREWIESLPVALSDEAELALDLGEQNEALGPQLMPVRVGVGDGIFSADRPTLSPEQAMAVLARPLHVVLENHRTDRAALLAFAPETLRQVFEEAERRGWLEFWNGGGIHGCLGRAKQLAERGPGSLRTFVLVDSDARDLGGRSRDAQSVYDALEAARASLGWTSSAVSAPGHVLSRRMVENYTPWGAFQTWLPPLSQTDRQAVEDARIGQAPLPDWPKTSNKRLHLVALVLQEVSLQVWSHMDMDAGRQTVKPCKIIVRTEDAVWNTLTSWEKAVLQHGVGKTKIREFLAQSSNLADPSGEILAILQAIRKIL